MANGFDDEQTVIFKLGQIESKLDLIALSIQEHIKKDDDQHEGADKRIASLEKSRSWAVGAMAAISIGVQFVMSKIS